MSNYPENNRRNEIIEQVHTVEDFVDWLETEKRIDLGRLNSQRLVDEFFGFDRKKLEEERLSMLEELRSLHA